MSQDQGSISLAPSTPVIFRSPTPSASELANAVRQQLNEITTLLKRIGKSGAVDLLPTTLASAGFMAVEAGGPDKTNPTFGRIHDVILGAELRRTPGSYFVGQDGRLLICVNPNEKHEPLRFMHALQELSDLEVHPRSTLYIMLEDLKHLTKYLRQQSS